MPCSTLNGDSEENGTVAGFFTLSINAATV